MLWPEIVKKYLKDHNLENTYGEESFSDLYNLADKIVRGRNYEKIITDCKGKYDLCGYEPAVRVPICEEDHQENLYTLAFFYTCEIIGEIWS